MILKEKKISSSLVYDGRIIKLYKDEVELDDGVKAFREVVHHNGGACALVKTKENKIIFVKQYRYAFKEEMIELPAGKIELNEDPLNTIIREVEEEVGVKPLNATFIGKLYLTPGFCDEIIYLYYIDEYIETSTHFDFDESIDRIELTIDEAIDSIEKGIIKDAKTISLIYRMKDKF